MNRFMQGYLLLLSFAILVLALLNYIPLSPLDFILSLLYFLLTCNLFNALFARYLGVRSKPGSSTITALILTFIFGPLTPLSDFLSMTIISLLAISSKYIFTYHNFHLFNPAAFAAVVAGLAFGVGASWWVGGIHLLPLLILGGVLLTFKLRHHALILGFVFIYALGLLATGAKLGLHTVLVPSLWFFVFVMLVEPITAPPAIKHRQYLFGGFVALCYLAIPKLIPGYAYSLETSIILGNLLNFKLSPKYLASRPPITAT